MYVIDGVAYAGEPVAEMQVMSVKTVGNLCALVTFSTGEVRLFDAAPLLEMQAFASLADPDVFSSAVVEHGVVTWNRGKIDIAPEQMYDMSYPYERVA